MLPPNLTMLPPDFTIVPPDLTNEPGLGSAKVLRTDFPPRLPLPSAAENGGKPMTCVHDMALQALLAAMAAHKYLQRWRRLWETPIFLNFAV